LGLSNRHRSPSDLRRREARAAQRATLREAGQLTQQPNTFRYFVNRLNPRRAIFESPAKQQDLNIAIRCSAYETGATEHSGGRLSVLTKWADGLAEELVAKGWIKLS
jgi:hypothetical protein